MWVKTASWILMGAVAACAGCAASPARYRMEDTGPQAAPVRAVAVQRAAPNGALDEAVALAADGRYDDAAERFASLIDEFRAAGDRAHLAEATFWLGFCREKQGRTDDARRLYLDVERSWPDEPAARPAAERLSLLAPPSSR